MYTAALGGGELYGHKFEFNLIFVCQEILTILPLVPPSNHLKMQNPFFPHRLPNDRITGVRGTYRVASADPVLAFYSWKNSAEIVVLLHHKQCFQSLLF